MIYYIIDQSKLDKYLNEYSWYIIDQSKLSKYLMNIHDTNLLLVIN